MKPLEVLDRQEMIAIHQRALEVISRVGLKIDHPGVLKRLADAGATVDLAVSRVRFSPTLVGQALERVPKHFVCAGCTSEYDIPMAVDQAPVVMRTGAGCIEHFDPLTNRNRSLTQADAIQYARLADALPNVDIFATLTPRDLSSDNYDVQTFRDSLLNCRKHIWTLTTSASNLAYQLEMATMVAGGRNALAHRPIMSGIVSLIDPFFLPADDVERLLLYGAYGIPLRVPIVPMMGATAPYPVAGALVQATAEFLASTTVIQSLFPGMAVYFYVVPRAMDMRTGASVSASCPETVFFIAAVAQLSRYYQIPASINAGSTTCCQMHQAMFQYGNALAMVLAAGAAEVGGIGSLNGGNSCSPDILVLGDELVAYFRHLFNGFAIDDATMCVEVLERVGPQGHFLADDHTLTHFHRHAHFTPTLLQFGTYEEWAQGGYQTVFERAHQKRLSLQATHRVPELDPALVKELDRIVAASKRR